MRQEEALSELVGNIYDTALDVTLWPHVLDGIAGFVRGPAATLFIKDASSKTGDHLYDNGGIDPDYVALYFRSYIKLDPVNTRHFFADVGEPMATADLVDYDEFLTSRLYQEWARPQGLVDFISAVLDKSATSVAMFGVFRHERDGTADSEARRRMRLLAPHVRRAVLISRVIELKSAEAATFADTLDGLSAAMLLVDASGRIVHANVAGHAMLAAGDVLRAMGGRLLATQVSANQELSDAFLATREGDTALGVRGVAVPLASRGGDQFVVHVLPLTAGQRRRAGASYSAAAAVFVHKAALDIRSPPEVIAKSYRLTPSELRILLAVVEVGGAPEVAEALGIAESTVKFHLRRLFEKTGTRRQADLVKLVAGFASPLT